MRKSAPLILALIAHLYLVAYAYTTPEFVSNQLLVTTTGIESDSRFRELNSSCGTQLEEELRVMARGKIYLLKIVDGRSVEHAIKCWEQFPEVEYAGPSYIRKPMN